MDVEKNSLMLNNKYFTIATKTGHPVETAGPLQLLAICELLIVYVVLIPQLTIGRYRKITRLNNCLCFSNHLFKKLTLLWQVKPIRL